MRLTDKGRAKLALQSTGTQSPTPSEDVVEQMDAADADLAASLQPTEDELLQITEKMDKIAALVVASPAFVHSNNHRPDLLAEVVPADGHADKLQAAMDALTIEDDPEIIDIIVKAAEKETENNLSSDGATAAAADPDDDEDEADREDDEDDQELVFNDDDMVLFEELSGRFLATARTFAPAEGARYVGAFMNLVRAVKRGMGESKKLKQTTLHSFFQ